MRKSMLHTTHMKSFQFLLPLPPPLLGGKGCPLIKPSLNCLPRPLPPNGGLKGSNCIGWKGLWAGQSLAKWPGNWQKLHIEDLCWYPIGGPYLGPCLNISAWTTCCTTGSSLWEFLKIESTSRLLSSFNPLVPPNTFFRSLRAVLCDLWAKLSTKDWTTITCCCHSKMISFPKLFSRAKL